MISEIAGKWEIIILLEILYFCDAQFGCLLLIFVCLFFSNDSVDREEETIQDKISFVQDFKRSN